MLPRLQAQERLGALDVAFMGAGAYDERTARQMLAALRSQASGEPAQRAMKANAAQLAAIGISVREVPAKRALSDG